MGSLRYHPSQKTSLAQVVGYFTSTQGWVNFGLSWWVSFGLTFTTVFSVNLQSVKKVSSADVVVGVKGVSDAEPLIIERRINPNVSHPLRQSDILEKIGNVLNGVKFTSFTLQALVWKYDIKNKSHLYWRPDKGGVIQYSPELISFIKKLSKNELETAVNDYKKFRKRHRCKRKRR